MANLNPGSGDGGNSSGGDALRNSGDTVDFIRGVAKGNTTDFVNFAQGMWNYDIRKDIPRSEGGLGTGQDKITEPLGDKIFSAVVQTPKDNLSETLGSMVSIGGLGKAIVTGAAPTAKAMIVAAARTSRGAEAEKLAAKGVSNAELFDKTGAYVDSDRKLKAAISDSGMKLKPEGLNSLAQGKTVTASDLIDHPELFSAYPELKKMEIDKSNKITGLGAYNPVTKSVILTDRPLSAQEYKSVLLHEMQHGIQGIEGFTNGGSIKQFLTIDPKKVQDTVSKARQSSDSSVREAAERLKERANEKIQNAQTQYMNIPGEQEARFTQSAMELDTQSLGAKLLQMIRSGVTPQSHDTRALPSKSSKQVK